MLQKVDCVKFAKTGTIVQFPAARERHTYQNKIWKDKQRHCSEEASAILVIFLTSLYQSLLSLDVSWVVWY